LKIFLFAWHHVWDIPTMDQFEALEITTPGTTIFLRRLGSGPGLLLLHGFPQTHLMWRDVAPLLAKHFTVICADLRGYGHSGCPLDDPDHTPYTKRAMANDMVSVMEQLGFPQFSVAGHDRGGRVAYRLALDHPERIQRLAILDVIPTAAVWNRADRKFATSFWPWTLLAQPAPLPEQLIAAVPDAVIDDALSNWGTPAVIFPPHIREAYIEALRDPLHVHAICEEYRAGATLDYYHDMENDQKITCPVLVLWSAGSALDNWYHEDGGPLGIWENWADHVTGWPVSGGHFFPEEIPEETAIALTQFFQE
jgi:haloacetate dehalogenase